MLKATDLKGKIIEGKDTIANTHRIIKGVFKKLKDGMIVVNTSEKVDDFLSMDSEDFIHVEDVTHIDGVAVSIGYEKRPVEMYFGKVDGSGDDSGNWFTEYIHIPYNTPENKVSSTALELYQKALDEAAKEGYVVAFFGVYSIPPLEDVVEYLDEYIDETSEEIVYYPLVENDTIEVTLFNLYKTMGIDKPRNHKDILAFVEEDVKETADPINWHSGDVAIAFRRWMEEKPVNITNGDIAIAFRRWMEEKPLNITDMDIAFAAGDTELHRREGFIQGAKWAREFSK